ncbi:MAG: hypothetical protein ACK5E3_12270 [Planctomycetota bacterium]
MSPLLGATDMSPLRGFEDAGAPMSCYQYVAPLGLFRPVWADRIVAQRANILVASPDQENTLAPAGPPTAQTTYCTDAGYQYVAPLGL